MNAERPVEVEGIYLPEPVANAISAVPTLPALLGEVRCLTEPVLRGIQERIRLREYSGTDLALQARLGVISRMADDHPSAVADAIHPTLCSCSQGTGVTRAVLEVLANTPRKPAPKAPGTGAYL